MSEIQHAGAKKLLGVITRVGAHSDSLTYRSAAKMIGVAAYEKHSRAVAQMCDLLDAAACLAGVPLLALVAVRSKSGKVNPKTWAREYSSARSVIIDRSLNHRFSRRDFKAVGRALSDLKGLGNRKAWAFVKRTYGDLLYRRLIGDYSDSLYGALDDLGTDDPARILYAGYTYLRDQKVRSAVLLRAAGRCEYCGENGFLKEDDSRYLETHHVIALANDGEDRLTNVIGLCPSDHRKAHFSANRESMEQEMLLRLKVLNAPTKGSHP
jgi:hypothetical protein